MPGNFHGMERACASEGDKREFAGIMSLLDGSRANSVGHVAGEYRVDAFGGLIHIHVETLGQPFDNVECAFGMNLHRAAQKMILTQATENEVGVRDRRFLATAAI